KAKFMPTDKTLIYKVLTYLLKPVCTTFVRW
ncbi:MAG: hypothetical protein ACI9O3_000957, partial [Colwellia sp.]